MKVLKVLGVLLAVAISAQSFAETLGRSRPSTATTYANVTIKPGPAEKFKWINGLCFDLQVNSAGVIEDYNQAIVTCPRLPDYSQVQSAYADRKIFSVPPHVPGSICLRNASYWTWAESVGPIGSECRAPNADGTYLMGKRF
jgi:hypothetical protein